MNFLEPKVSWWPQKTIAQQIAKVGRICYKSEGKQPSSDMTEEERNKFIEERDEKRANDFWKSGHRSMYRHGTAYFFVKHSGKLPGQLWALMTASPYIDYVQDKNHVWISTNMQFVCEHKRLMDVLHPFTVDENAFVDLAQQYDCKDALMLLRMTLVVTTQISTTRELNRTSPNNIAEQSTRYVNFEKKGGVGIAEPHWYQHGSRWQKMLYYCGCKVSEWMYHLLLRSGMKPQDARGVLPLDTFSIVAYTYNLKEWKHIVDLRYRGTTGAPHPNAKIIGEQISNIINTRMRTYIPNFEI